MKGKNCSWGRGRKGGLGGGGDDPFKRDACLLGGIWSIFTFEIWGGGPNPRAGGQSKKGGSQEKTPHRREGERKKMPDRGKRKREKSSLGQRTKDQGGKDQY